MNDTTLKQKVTRAVQLDRVIAGQLERLKELKAEIAAEAESRQDEATPTEGGGTSLILEGNDGCVCRVTITKSKLKADVDPDAKGFAKIRKLCAGKTDAFLSLFKSKTVYVPVEEFRAKAKLFLGTLDGPKLIKLCESKGQTTVSFETKEAVSS